MRFQTRLLLTYSVLVVLLVIVLAVGFYSYSAREFENNASASLTVIAEKMSQQLDNLIRPMDFVTTYLLSTGDFISSMASLATLDRNDPRNLFFINEGWQTINSTLLSYSIGKNFYSVNVFNRKGDFLSSNFSTHGLIRDAGPLLGDSPWLERADAALGRALILPPYVDPWNGMGEMTVFGLARSVQGPKGGIGYIEVQNAVSDAERVFSIPNRENIAVLALMGDGGRFYTNRPTDDRLLRHYAGLAKRLSSSVTLSRNPVTARDEIVAGSSSEYTGISVVLAQDKNTLLAPLLFTRNMTFLLAFLVIAVSFVYNYLSSRRLTLPLRRLAENMERTGLENLPERFAFEKSNDEIEALNTAFRGLRDRLNEAVGREISAQSLQMQARLDSLQAQVNPHFIYNVLTVISSRGLEAGDEEICEICDGIAAMLRYSTSTAERMATIGEEVRHVETYLSLMKRRFEHRLEYTIDVDPAIMAEAMPKIVLQQIAENSINHGYVAVQKIMHISVTGFVDGGRWFVRMADDGQGFAPAALGELKGRMDAIRAEIARPGGLTGMAIGGMGLVNTCARLALSYGPGFVLVLENRTDGGAVVTVGAPRGAAAEVRGHGAAAAG